jgi:large subunit ribosomal protein L10
MRGIDWKKSEVDLVSELARSHPVIGVASIHEIPAKQFQSLRRDLRNKVEIKVSKKTLINKAFDDVKKDKIKDLEASMGGEVALLFTEMNPFRLFRYLEDNKVQSPAKPGHRPPEDVWVSKGETSFPPGPIVSQLQKVGIPARIERGKVVILEDTLFVKAGEQIDRARSDILSDLGIEPMRIGLDVAAIFENGTVFERSILDVDADEILGQLSEAARQAFNLAVNSSYITGTTILPLIQKAFVGARSLSLESGFPTTETIPDLLSIGNQRMLSLAAVLAGKNPEAVGEELVERIGSVKAETKPEPEAKQDEDKSEEEEKEEEKEEEEGVGLGALFG